MAFKDEVVEILNKHLNLGKEKVSHLLEIPPNPKLGDIAFPCFTLSTRFKKNPQLIAEELLEKIKNEKTKYIESIKIVGAYLNFFENKKQLVKTVLEQITNSRETYGYNDIGKGKIVLVESPGPNTNKPLHLGHVRNMCLGMSMLNLFKANGFTSYLVNVVNDRGVHICQSMLAYKKFGNNDSPTKSKMKGDHFVGKYYVLYSQKEKENPNMKNEVQEMLLKWEHGDKETMELWKKMNNWCYEGFDITYKKFGVYFKKQYYESETYLKGKEIVLSGVKKGIFKEKDDGSIVADLTKYGLGEKVLIRADGTSVYITQDIYLAKKRYDDFKFDKMIYVVASEQNYHFKVLFKIFELLSYTFAKNCYHFSYGMVNLPEGKMKSREGTVVDADELVEEVEKEAIKEVEQRYKDLTKKEIKRRAEIIAMAAIKFLMLKIDPLKDFVFNPKESISFEGETGPYVLYTYARLGSILKKFEESGGKVSTTIDYDVLTMEKELKLIKLLKSFPFIVVDAVENYKPSLITSYLIKLCQEVNNFYHENPVLQAEEHIKKARILLINCVRVVIRNALSLLNIDVLEQM